MRLRTFLVRRTIHTVITLVIVLVLLFVIFRLMPGDPTRFFLRPGQTPEDREVLLVQFGFKHWEPAPGNGLQAVFETKDQGTYEITYNATDSSGRGQQFYFYYVKQVRGFNEPSVEVATTATNGAPAWDVHPNDRVFVNASVQNPPRWTAYNVTITVSRSGLVQNSSSQSNLSSPYYNVTWQAPAVGAYSVSASFRNASGAGGPILGYSGVAVNVVDPSPFSFPPAEWGLRARPTSERLDSAWAVVNVTSSGATIAHASATVRTPGGTVIPSFDLFHPLVAVKNNLLQEFWTYMLNMLQFNFGQSLYTRQNVTYEISIRAGPTLLLFGSAVVISYALGILIGAVLAWRRGSKVELSAIIVSLFFYSMPVFWFGLILLWAFAFTLNWFPLRGFADLDAVQAGGLTYVGNVLWHMALPLLNLVILSLAGHVLLMRSSMLEVMGEDYITTARAKGLSERRIMYRHAARNALLPVVTAFALAISGVISGGVLTETIFSWPGMGAFLVQSTLNQDFPSVQGAFYLLAVLTIVANLVADVLYAYLDPRVRL